MGWRESSDSAAGSGALGAPEQAGTSACAAGRAAAGRCCGDGRVSCGEHREPEGRLCGSVSPSRGIYRLTDNASNVTHLAACGAGRLAARRRRRRAAGWGTPRLRTASLSSSSRGGLRAGARPWGAGMGRPLPTGALSARLPPLPCPEGRTRGEGGLSPRANPRDPHPDPGRRWPHTDPRLRLGGGQGPALLPPSRRPHSAAGADPAPPPGTGPARPGPAPHGPALTRVMHHARLAAFGERPPCGETRTVSGAAPRAAPDREKGRVGG